VNHFAQAIGRQPNLVTYYSSWGQPFEANFATSAMQHGALALVQIDPKNISLASMASGQYDGYLRSYASAVKAFDNKVVLSFGHEMNGYWYSWANQHTPAKTFVAAWRHMVNVFRAQGASNVIWMWTVNIIEDKVIPEPTAWWPGSSYVNWVGIDGYYYSPNWTFPSLFGPTIVAVRTVTHDPIVIAETGAAKAADQPAKITDLFSGIQAYGLLGFVWFDANDVSQRLDWRLDDPASLAAFRKDAKTFMRPSASPQQHPSSGSAP
jgi:hypothetical protein